MAAIQVTKCDILKGENDNILTPITIVIEYESLQDLEEDMQVSVGYTTGVKQYDQELYSVAVGPIQKGKHTFKVVCDAIDPYRLPEYVIKYGDNGAVVIEFAYPEARALFCNVGYVVGHNYLVSNVTNCLTL